MIVEEVRLRDFLSFKDATLRFPKAGLILLTGWDEDLGRANGAGKSTLFMAIAWCVYGELPKNIKVGEIARRGEKKCSVYLRFKIGDTTYEITRKVPSAVELLIDGVRVDQAPKQVQAIIAQVVGLSYDQFLVTSYFPQKGDSSRFLRQNDVNAKSFLGSIMGFSQIDSAHEKFKLELKELFLQRLRKVEELENLQRRVESISALAISEPEKPDVREAHEIKADLDKVRAILASPPNTEEVDKTIARLREAQRRVSQDEALLASKQRFVDESERKIRHLQSEPYSVHVMTCPSCAAELVEKAGKLLEFDESSAEEVVADQIDRLKASVDKERVELVPLQERIKRFDGLDEKLDAERSARASACKDFEVAREREATILARSSAFQDKVKAYARDKKRSEEAARQLQELHSNIDVVRGEIEVLEASIAETEDAKAITSPTGVIAYSLDSVIQDINDQTSAYLDVFSHGTMTYKLATSDDKGKVYHSLAKGGSDVSVASLSGGEDRGLVLSVDLGLSEVIATRRGAALPSILMLDECFEGLDYVGKEKVIDALREVSRERCIVVIDHSTEFSALFDENIKVVKKNDVSEIA